MDSTALTSSIFEIRDTASFERMALDIFKYQYQNNPVYQEFCRHLGKDLRTVERVMDIPFLPISFFKTQKIISNDRSSQLRFTSSGTTGAVSSKHYVSDVTVYRKSYLTAFELFYGSVTDYCILALLPSYLEREGSSLIYMANDLIARSAHPSSGFYLNDLERLQQKISELQTTNTKILLIGVSFALLDLAEAYTLPLENTIVMETGGMKGRRKEMIREELHSILGKSFGLPKIHSEYGMTELLSQAYSYGDGIFKTPPWMKIIVRDTEDPLHYPILENTGGINIIDLANIYSCSFIATQDLGKVHTDGSFEVLGRYDHSDVRGCNLMAL